MSRGRPRKYDDDEMQDLVGNATHAKTRRGQQDTLLGVRAYQTLLLSTQQPGMDEEVRQKIEYLLEERARPSVLTELGRFLTDDPVEESIAGFWNAVSLVIANPEMPAKALIRRLRGLRLGGDDDEAEDALALALARTVDQYMQRYPGLTYDHIELAWESVREAMESVRNLEAASDNQE